MVTHFDEIATNYEAVMKRVGYIDPEKITEMLTRIANGKQ